MHRQSLINSMRDAGIDVNKMNEVLKKMGLEEIKPSPMHNLYPSKKIMDMLWQLFQDNKKISAIKELRGIFSVMSGDLPLDNFRDYAFHKIVTENNFEVEPKKAPETVNYIYFASKNDHDLMLLGEKLRGQPAGLRMFTCTMCDGKHYFA